jgi:hypothetical protein
MKTSTIVAPPLDLDLNTVDTSMPLIAQGSLADFNIVKVEAKKTAAGGSMLSLDSVTTSPTKAEDGHDLGPGIHVFHNLNLAPSGKATWDMVIRNIAAVTQAAGVTTTYGDLVANPVATLQGKQFRAKLNIAPAGTDRNGKSYRAKNEFAVFMKVQ